MKGVATDELARRYPQLYHMAAPDAFDSILRYGLLSTTSLLDLFEIVGAERRAIELARRPTAMTITHPVHGTAVIRDQKVLSESKLANSLTDGLTPRQWYRLLNNHVYFWLTQERLQTLLNARAYRGTERLILTLDTTTLLGAYSDRILLSPMNTGNTSPFAHPRGKKTFLSIRSYPFQDRITRHLEPVVELAVQQGISDVGRFIISAHRMSATDAVVRIYSRSQPHGS